MAKKAKAESFTINPESMAATEVAACFGVSKQAIAGWKAKGCPCENGKYHLQDVIKWKLDRVKIELAATEPNSRKFTDDQLRLQSIKADRAEMELKRELGELVLKVDVEKDLELIGRRTKQEVMRIPRIAAARLYGKQPRQIQHELTVICNQVLSDLSR